MGDSSVVEFLRDLSIIIAVGMSGVLLLVLTLVALMLYKKVSRTLTAIQGAAESAQQGSKAILDKIIKPATGNTAASFGVGRIAGFVFGLLKSRNSKKDKSKKDSKDSKDGG